MAIVSSTALGSASRSAGVLTYRKVRGRIIASQRVVENKSRTPLQVEQRGKFANASAILSALAFLISKTFEKSTYGSARNNFYKQNKEGFQQMDFSSPIPTDPYPLLLNLASNKMKYFCFGGGNVKVTRTEGSEPGLAAALSFQAFNVAKEDCSVTIIEVTKDNTIVITDASEHLQSNSSTGSVTYDTSTFSPTVPEGCLCAIVFKTPNGIAKCPYLLKLGV